ncbi:hypothetical protein A4X09_0g6937 [Tilletia walkeri]|uniref:Uncharacterized protein n=1 Tax=Tilletia walkeri TaxID=117179 RepID=A0A8X7N2U4_9BASI|nr:hypothetical protein A4X09_0g6937 [Tilletia walkeri]
MDFLRQARDRAQDVVAQAQQQLQQQQQKHAAAAGTSSPGTSPMPASSSSQQLTSTGNTRPAVSSNNSSSLPGLAAFYTGSLPPLIRSGIASLDPRFESARQTHLLSNALKALNIDHEATARETKAAATATFKWGSDLSPLATSTSSPARLDGSCDPALVDITDRMAYVLSTIGDLEAAHVKRAEAARKEFKDIARAESELSSRREKRVKVHKELLALVPERAKPSSSKRIGELEAQLKSLESEDKSAEETFGKLRRQKFQSSYAQYMDSFVELGEKLACAARYGKLLATMVPADETPVFPAASLSGVKGWDGAHRTAQVRSAIDPALHSLQVNHSLPNLDSTGTSSAALPAPVPVESYADTHAADIAEADRTHQAVLAELANAPSSTDSAGNTLHAPPPLNRFDSGSSYGASPSNPTVGTGAGASASPIAARLNMGPTPHLPPSPMAPTSATNDPSSASAQGDNSAVPPALNPDAPDPTSPHAPPEDVTVAETGAAIYGTGGPKTGTLGVPRRKSAVPGSTAAPPSSSSNPFTSNSALPSTTGPSPATAPPSSAAAAKSAEAAAERLAAEQADVQARAERERASHRASYVAVPPAVGGGGGGQMPAVHARLRRDGTIVRRGEADWAAAENEDLPPYTVQDGSGGGPPA